MTEAQRKLANAGKCTKELEKKVEEATNVIRDAHDQWEDFVAKVLESEKKLETFCLTFPAAIKSFCLAIWS